MSPEASRIIFIYKNFLVGVELKEIRESGLPHSYYVFQAVYSSFFLIPRINCAIIYGSLVLFHPKKVRIKKIDFCRVSPTQLVLISCFLVSVTYGNNNNALIVVDLLFSR